MNLTKSIISFALLIVLVSVPAFARDVNSELIEAAENGPGRDGSALHHIQVKAVMQRDDLATHAWSDRLAF